jgi:hypothetical protein
VTTSLDPPPSLVPPTAVAEAGAFRQELAERFFAYDEIRNLPVADQEALFLLLSRIQAGDYGLLRDVYTLVYEEVPVDMEEFVLGRRYLNLRNRINREKLDILVQFSHPSVRKLWCAAGSGGGKSFMVSVVQAWMVYQLLCLKRPDFFYMLGPGSKIATVNLSVGKDQAKDVVFGEFVGRVKSSRWFSGKFEPQAGRMLFPKNVFALSGGSAATSYYGYHTIMGSLDEASYMIDRLDRSMAEELTEALTKSLSTRFPNAYKLMVISTLRADDDFLYTNIQRIREEGAPVLTIPDPFRPAV